MSNIVSQILISSLCALTLSACALTRVQGPEFAAGIYSQQKNEQLRASGFEVPRLLPAAQFLPAQLMQSPLHRVDPMAFTDGYANTYRIITPKHDFIVLGTHNVAAYIEEIHAIDTLRGQSTVGTALNAVVERTTNLVETPIRAAKIGVTRMANAGGPLEALMVIPSGAAEFVGNVAHGLKEIGVTGIRITTSAAGTKCQGYGCLTKAGRDIWSGFNSLAGKHQAAKEIHAKFGTDPYTQNLVLRREVDRLAYADAYTSTSVKFGFTWSNVAILDPLATNVGYINNGEFLAGYNDAHRDRNAEKAIMVGWGADEAKIRALYKNKSYTHKTRSRLLAALGALGNDAYKSRLAVHAGTADTRFVAQSILSVYEYLAYLASNGQLAGFVAETPLAIAITNDGVMILPFAADYLSWTPEIEGSVKSLAALAPAGKREIHILGEASPAFIAGAKKLGVRVAVLSPQQLAPQ